VDLKDDVRNLKDGNPPGLPRGRRNAKKIAGSVLSNGVERVTVDLGGKVVTVDHDPLIVPASAIVSRLRALDYDASLLKDGASDLVPSSSNPTPHATARTQLYVAGICCASEVPAVTSILRRHPKGGVKKVNINIPARYVYVDHDPFVVTAGDLADELNEEGFGAKVRRDGGRNVPKPGTQPSPATAAENAAKKSDGEAAKAVNGAIETTTAAHPLRRVCTREKSARPSPSSSLASAGSKIPTFRKFKKFCPRSAASLASASTSSTAWSTPITSTAWSTLSRYAVRWNGAGIRPRWREMGERTG